MSEIEFHIGKMTEINYKSLGYHALEDYCKDKCKENNIELEIYQENYTEAWIDYNYKNKIKLISYKNKLYKLDDKEYEDPYISEMKRNDDGSFDYVFGFYNGGTCLNELIKEELEKVEESARNS